MAKKFILLNAINKYKNGQKRKKSLSNLLLEMFYPLKKKGKHSCNN